MAKKPVVVGSPAKAKTTEKTPGKAGKAKKEPVAVESPTETETIEASPGKPSSAKKLVAVEAPAKAKTVAKSPRKAGKAKPAPVAVESPTETETIEESSGKPGTGKNLVIVESPAKAKTIEKILGKDFSVKACMGHVRDLPKGKFGIDIENGFEPSYQILETRAKTITELKAAARKAKAVYLAPDPDREGEAIAWHLAAALKLDEKKIFRVTFNEITKKAVAEAFEHPGKIIMDRVYAQQARRFLDRIVGYKLSPLLWKKVARGLSAGRVQSVATKLIVDREDEIKAFKSEEYWRLAAHLFPRPEDATAPAAAAPGEEAQPPKPIVAELKRVADKEADLRTEAQTQALVEEIRGEPFRIVKVEKKERSEEPPPPFTTSTLQQQASIRLRYTTKRAMAIAQQLYEGVELGDEGSVGLITYMRTDSVRMSDDAIAEARTYITKTFGPQNLEPEIRRFKARARAQEAHEAIRPSSMGREPEAIAAYLSHDQYKLYRMIWRRAMATQMAPALYLNTDAEISAGRATFSARGRELRAPGFTLLAGLRLKPDEQILPPLRQGQVLVLDAAMKPEEPSPGSTTKRIHTSGMVASQHFTQPPPRFTEATLVKGLEKNGIGRPSTYAPIISTIQERGYVRSEERKLYATDLGSLVTKKLERFFNDIMDYTFTSQMEEKLDLIEESKVEWRAVLKQFYDLFAVDLQRATEQMESERGITPEGTAPCEKCAKPMVVRWNKMGNFLGCGDYPNCKSTRPINPPEMTEEACEKCGKRMVVRTGRLGRFLACSGYPECKTTKSIHMDKGTLLVINEDCEKCGSKLVMRRGRRGRFLACPKYPECKFTKPLPKASDMKAVIAAGLPGAPGAPPEEEEGKPAEGEELE